MKPPEIVSRLRDYDSCSDEDVDKAADILEFFFSRLQMRSPKMDGQHSYSFMAAGWPMNHCVGPNAEIAVEAAIAEVKREQAASGRTDK